MAQTQTVVATLHLCFNCMTSISSVTSAGTGKRLGTCQANKEQQASPVGSSRQEWGPCQSYIWSRQGKGWQGYQGQQKVWRGCDGRCQC